MILMYIHEGNKMNLTDKQKMQQRMALPFEDKLQLTKLRIKDWYKHWDGEVYVAFSGGRDSTVLLHIVRTLFLDVPAVFSDTGLEMPEIREFVKSIENVVRVRPKKPFNRVIDEDGFALISKQTAKKIRVLKEGDTGRNSNMHRLYNTGYTSDGTYSQRWKIPEKWRGLVDADVKISEACCDHLKKEPLDTYAKESGRVPFTGMMISEGGAREKLTQCNAYDSAKPKSSPMLFWNSDDVDEYIKRYSVDICDVYYDRLVDTKNGELFSTAKDAEFASLVESLVEKQRFDNIIIFDNGLALVPAEKRTGCMFCMFGVHMEKGANRFQRMYYTHPRHWDTCINKLGLSKPLDLIDVKYIPE